MNQHPLDQLDPQVASSDSAKSTLRRRKRDLPRLIILYFKNKAKGQSLHSHSASQQSTRPVSVVSQVRIHPPGDHPPTPLGEDLPVASGSNQPLPSLDRQSFNPSDVHLALTSDIQAASSSDNQRAPSSVEEVKRLPSLPSNGRPISTQSVNDIFAQNVPKPVNKTDLPRLQQRIERTKQLVYCNTLLVQDSLSSSVTATEVGTGKESIDALQQPALDKTELTWLEETKKDPLEQDRLRCLPSWMVEQFVADANKNSTKVAEIVSLGPVLQKEPYRKLLSSFIQEFSETRILDVNILQGLVQLVQATSPGYLLSADLVKILGVVRVHLEGTHQQSTEYSYYLTLAVSRVLDVMADHKVQDLDRVLDHAPLSAVLSGLKDSTDPYLMYQACYAFQALRYVPDDETALHALLRHSFDVVNGVVKVTAVFKLDLTSVLDGLASLVTTGVTVYDGVCSLIETGRAVLDRRSKDLKSGQKRLWYPAVKAAYAFSQAGQLKDLKRLIFEAPCRRDPLFQWGICQLLGEIAVDPLWTSPIRQQSVNLLGHLYQHSPDWGHDESVRKWMVAIISKLGASSDNVVNKTASTLLQDLKHDQTATVQLYYPLTARLAIPESSPVLATMLDIPNVDYDLHRLRLQRLEEAKLPVYIPPMAKANLQARDEDVFPLMAKVEDFLASNRQVMLILGDSGAGKSTFNKHLESELLRTYLRGGPFPLFINLPNIDEPQRDMIEKQLKTYSFSEDQVKELKLHRQLILICDGYDESQQLVNLHNTNSLNQPGQWDTKMIISCRSQYLDQDYRSRFIPQGSSHYARPAIDLFQEAAITPFSEEQIVQYIEQYVPLEPRSWGTQDYMDKLVIIPNLMDLVRNPFVLTLALEALPLVVEGKQDLSTIRITRVQLYDKFVIHWLDVNKRRLERMALSNEDRAVLSQLSGAGFTSMGTEYSTKLASAIFQWQGGNPVVQYIHLKDKKSWKADFFGLDPEIRLLRESSPLSRTGNLFRFLHRSMQEYFYSRAVFDPSAHVVDETSSPQPDPDPAVAQSLDPNGPLFRQNLLAEPSVIRFLSERVKQYSGFQEQLLAVIQQSKTDPTAATAAANAATILVRAGVRFNGADLRGIRIPGADLSDSQLDSAQLQDADLTDVTFTGSWLRQVDLSGAQLGGLRLGELPSLEEERSILTCTYSPDGKMLAVGTAYIIISIYDTTTWNRAYQHSVDGAEIMCVAFSPNSQQLVYGTDDGIVQLWNFATDGTVLDMVGHSDGIMAVAFSPCGKQFASASADKTVRLWSPETVECLFVLEGHTFYVVGVAYCAEGKRLVSSENDIRGPSDSDSDSDSDSGERVIRVWDSKTGEQVACWSVSHRGLSALAFSTDGLWVATALGRIQLTNVVTGESGPVLNSKGDIARMAFSPNGQWIVTSSVDDNSLRLWDISSGLPISTFSGHADQIWTLSFSPSCAQIASGDEEGHVRLWEIDTGRAILNLDGPTGPVRTVTYCPDGRSILSSSDGQGVQQWNFSTGEPAPPPRKIASDVSLYAFSPDGIQIATGHRDGTIRLWKHQADTVECTLLGHSQTVLELAYSPCGRWIVSVAEDGARLWDMHTNQHPGFLAEVEYGQKYPGYCVAFTPSSQIVLSLQDFKVRLYDPRVQDPCTILKTIESTDFGTIAAMDCSPDGQEVAIGAYGEEKVYLWDFQSDKICTELKGHDLAVSSVAYSPCGQWILSGSKDKTVRVWRFGAGEASGWSCAGVVRGCSDSISSVAWNPVAALEFVTGCDDSSVRIWRIASHNNMDGGDVSVQMIWGNDVGILCASDLSLKGAIGLSPINQKLLLQRGAKGDNLHPEEDGLSKEGDKASEEEHD